jgi:regulatory protein YycI of two-component signal transduction system YycFG
VEKIKIVIKGEWITCTINGRMKVFSHEKDKILSFETTWMELVNISVKLNKL